MKSWASAYYEQSHEKNPVIIYRPEDIDRLIDSLLGNPVSHNMAQVHSLDRGRLPSGNYDHELLVGVNSDLQVGLVHFMDDDHGNICTLGNAESRSEVSYSIDGAFTEFPDNSEVSIDLVRFIVQEFVFSGGVIPSSVEWQPWLDW
ncbi:Imm1 family immunity protein [Nocardiopsis sp. CC223A]|uniref:Imm1 family immunity protein n=1 Tax=Nocardiopsis sp. CC223A TaxID=3044051 RepID=UPI0027960F0C|nr:Imm1 family immunity protein [Nocardiopsis sp. CC223A]